MIIDIGGNLSTRQNQNGACGVGRSSPENHLLWEAALKEQRVGGAPKRYNSVEDALCHDFMAFLTAADIHPKHSYRTTSRTTWPSYQIEPSNDARPNLVVLCLCMTITPEFRGLPKQTSSKPWAVPLPLMTDNLHF